MTVRPVVLLTPLRPGEGLEELLQLFADKGAPVRVVRDPDGMRTAVTPGTILLSYGSGVLIPPDVLLAVEGRAYNIHAASPDYPGRDPHHFAVQDGASRYGVTLHVATERVDAGPILDVEWFGIPPGTRPRSLLAMANGLMPRVLERNLDRLIGPDLPPPRDDVAWGIRKGTRARFQAQCRLRPTVPRDEFERRFQAFDGDCHDNLTVLLHGWTFRIDKSIPRQEPASVWTGFTEDRYRDLLRLAKDSGYAFASFASPPAGRHILWRHDVDLSMHRAVRLAGIEREEGVRATYFINPHCAFYNLLEPEISDLVRRLHALGHWIGLHFDADAYPGMDWTAKSLADALTRERRLIEEHLGCPVEAFSYHNPDIGDLLAIDQDQVAGLTNAYGRKLRDGYRYVSDSNGYWRFEPADTVIAAGTDDRIQVLTHPEWWTPEPLAPRDRVVRCLHGRADRLLTTYDAFLERYGRSNLT